MTEDADIGFHVYCMNGNDKVDVFPWERVSSHVAMEEGMTVCMRADTRRFISNIVLSTYYNDCLADYVEFDNSYSYLKSKKLWFTVAVEPPLQSEMDWVDFSADQNRWHLFNGFQYKALLNRWFHLIKKKII